MYSAFINRHQGYATPVQRHKTFCVQWNMQPKTPKKREDPSERPCNSLSLLTHYKFVENEPYPSLWGNFACFPYFCYCRIWYLFGVYSVPSLIFSPSSCHTFISTLCVVFIELNYAKWYEFQMFYHVSLRWVQTGNMVNSCRQLVRTVVVIWVSIDLIGDGKHFLLGEYHK